jgi:hypothetical protein
MSQAAEWLDELLESAGKAAPTIKAFAGAFPPQPRWGDPWQCASDLDEEPPAFQPRADSYAQALREVMTGRRRVRIDGRFDDDQPGSVVASMRNGPSSDGPSWILTEVRGL